jgi:hypothetical protein
VNRFLLAVCCAALLAVGQTSVAAAAGVEEVPVPGGIAGLAQALGIDPVPDRPRFMLEVTRMLYDTSELRSPRVAALLQSIRQPQRGRPSLLGPTRASDAVMVPLSAEVWSDAIFHRRVAREELVAAIVADRQAALLCHGLLRLDDETLAFLAKHQALLSRLYERSAPLVAAFAGSIRIRDNQLVPPGGADAAALWEQLVGEKVTRADRFVQMLFEINDGRLAYLYDAIGNLDPARRAFVLGTWMPAAARIDRFKALATTALNGVREWHVRTMPFGRSSFDVVMLLLRLSVAADGTPMAPAARGVWSRAFNGSDVEDEAPIDAAWLIESIGSTDVRQRSERIDQLTFGQRVFADATAAERADVLFVLRSLPRFRALVLSFERAGIRRPAVYAEVIRHAGKLASIDGRRGYVAQSQLQGALVLVTRMLGVRTLDVAAAERLIDRLIATPVNDANGYAGGIARWLRAEVHPLLPAASNIESSMIAALSGPTGDAARLQRVTWEGERYRLDLAGSERNRLTRIREKQRAPAIDLPLQMADAAHTLLGDAVTVDDMQDVAAQLAALAQDLPQRSREEDADNVPVGVAVPPPVHDALKKAADELTRAARGREVKRSARIAEPIVELADDLLARNLLSFAYAVSLGDPEGTVLLADDVSHRHDFGFGQKDGQLRSRLLWAVPRPEVAPGVPWHVTGSLMGLDVALATLTLRRVSSDHVLEAPKLTSNARDTFASSVALIDPLLLRDADRDAIANAIERGSERVANADPSALAAVAEELSLDAGRVRAIGWTLQHEPDRAPLMYSLTELLLLGGGRIADLQPWGMGVIAVNGCFCSRLLSADAWQSLGGRPQLGLAAAVVPDVNFRVAMVLKELNLPAQLARIVLSAAIQDFIDEVRPSDDNDWLSLSRTARAISRERIEDYVAAATATGPLLPDNGRSPQAAR